MFTFPVSINWEFHSNREVTSLYNFAKTPRTGEKIEIISLFPVLLATSNGVILKYHIYWILYKIDRFKRNYITYNENGINKKYISKFYSILRIWNSIKMMIFKKYH